MSLVTENYLLFDSYCNNYVTGSPFLLRVSSASLLTFTGSGLENGLLGRFEPEFLINTERAGKGDIKIKIGGPRGRYYRYVFTVQWRVYHSETFTAAHSLASHN